MCLGVHVFRCSGFLVFRVFKCSRVMTFRKIKRVTKEGPKCSCAMKFRVGQNRDIFKRAAQKWPKFRVG